MLELLGWGLAAGILGAILGIGGGILFVLILPSYLAVLGIPDSEIVSFTVANSLAATIFTTLSANFQQFRDKGFPWMEIGWISAGGILSSLLLLKFFVNTPFYSKQTFQLLFLLVLVYMLIRMLKGVWQKRTKQPEPENSQIPNKPILAITGLFSGCVSPLTGMGGGIVLVPILHSFCQMPIRRSQSISLGVITITALASSFYNLKGEPTSIPSVAHAGFLLFPVVGMLSLGGMIGAILGLQFSARLPEKASATLFAIFLVTVLSIQIFNVFS